MPLIKIHRETHTSRERMGTFILMEELIESVDMDEGEHYLVCFDKGIRKVVVIPHDAQFLHKSELNTDIQWLIDGLAEKLFLSRKILVIEPFEPKITVGELESTGEIKNIPVFTETRAGWLHQMYDSLDYLFTHNPQYCW